MEPARIIAVGNLKGGTGKSTLCLNLACALTEAGKPAAVIDTDPQGTCAIWTARRRLPAQVIRLPIRNLAGAGEWLGAIAEHSREFERIFIDLPAVVSPALAAAFLIADLILIPTGPSALELEATRRTLKHVEIARKERAASRPGVLIVPTRIERGLFGRSRRLERLAQLGELVAPPLHHDVAHQDAFLESDWIGGYAPRSRAHKDLLMILEAAEELLAGTASADEPVEDARLVEENA